MSRKSTQEETIMNPKKIETLVLAYKGLDPKHRTKRNNVFTAIIEQYKGIFRSLWIKCNYIPWEEFESQAHYQLLLAIESYKPASSAKFTTYAFYYIKSIIRKCVNEHNHLESFYYPDQEYQSVTLIDLTLDIRSILSDEEQLLLSSVTNRRIHAPLAEQELCNKLQEWLN